MSSKLPLLLLLARCNAQLLSWCEQKWTGLCEQKWNNALALLPAGVCSVILLVASAEDRALRGRNPSAV